MISQPKGNGNSTGKIVIKENNVFQKSAPLPKPNNNFKEKWEERLCN